MQTHTHAQAQPNFFDAPDGAKLYHKWYRAPGEPRAGVLVTHGYADHCGRYEEISGRLARQGFSVMAFDYRGHGQASGQRGHCDHFDEYLADFERACATVRKSLGDKPLVVVAHSHGAHIALRALVDPQRRPKGITLAVLSSPFLGIGMKVSPIKVALAKVASRVAPRLSMANQIDARNLSHDPHVIEAHAVDRFCHKSTTARWYTEATAAQAYVLEHVRRMVTPTLWVVAGDDRLVDVQVTRVAYARAGGNKQLKMYDGYYHEVFNELGRERVFADIESWLSSKISSL
jgi:alpha-beta hydrolase superfamily lysophospholipase